jgi:hypothetical protein
VQGDDKLWDRKCQLIEVGFPKTKCVEKDREMEISFEEYSEVSRIEIASIDDR